MGIKSLFKHLLLTIVVLSMYACGGGGESSHKTIIEVQKQQSTNLVFADQKLTDCVQALIDSEGYTLIEQITELSCIGKEIADIEGIQNLSFLEILNLSQNQIRDITPISKLGRLKQLYLQGNNLQLLSPIAENQLLEQVDISDNDAIICSERDKLDQSIGEENITANQPCVDSMQQAQDVTFEDTNLQACIRQTAQEIGAQHLEQIQQLKCVNRDISNIDGIEQLANLRELDLTQNNISDITPLQGLALLKKVLLGKNQISNIQPLTASQYMQELRLDYNQLNDIQDVQTLKALRQIHLTNNDIRDLTPLQSLTELLELRISNNRIIDIQALANLPKLTSLWIQGNQIADLAPLQSLQHLEQLWLSNNWLTDLTPLQTQSKLKWLHLDGTEVVDLNPLNELTQLKWLQLDNTAVVDITAIYPLTKLDWLHLKGNSTIPCSQLDQMEEILTPEKIDRPETCSQPQEQTGNPISTIEFQDTALRDCVYDAAREQGVINAEELTTLSCPEADITDITGLTQFPGITNIDLSGNDHISCAQLEELRYSYPSAELILSEQCNQPPIITAQQEQTVETGTKVDLNAQATDPNGDSLTYNWQQTAGQNVQLTNPNTATPFFIAPQGEDQTITFQLTVIDQYGLSATQAINILITGAILGSKDNPLLVSSYEDLKKVGTGIDGWNLDSHYLQTADIDATPSKTENQIPETEGEYYGFEPIGTEEAPFNGGYNGGGFEVDGLTINRSEQDGVGLFGFIIGGDIENTGLVNVDITGLEGVGGLVGGNAGIIINSYVIGSVIAKNDVAGGLVGISLYGALVDNSYATSSVTADDQIAGGLVGFNAGSIINSYATGDVAANQIAGGLVGVNSTSSIRAISDSEGILRFTCIDRLVESNEALISNSYAIGSVTAGNVAGGLAGFMCDDITNSYARGSVSSNSQVGGLVGAMAHHEGDDENPPVYSSVTNSYSTGLVQLQNQELESIDFGGLVGVSTSELNTVTNSFWDIETSGQSTSAGGTGLPTAEMQTRSTFTDAEWDFADTWVMRDYPEFQWDSIAISSIEFIDTALRDCVLETTQANGWTQSTQVINLNCSNLEITDTTGLEQLTEIIDLDLIGNNHISCNQLDELQNDIGEQGINRPEQCNLPPTISVEEQTVETGAQVNLNAEVVDPNGDILTYNWQQTGGQTVELTNQDTAVAIFIAPEDGEQTLSFQLTVTDPYGLNAVQSINISVVGVVLGTKDNPFLVTSYEDLKKVGTGTDGWNLDSHYKQTADIDALPSQTENPIDGQDGEYYGFEPIGGVDGDGYYEFTGSYDGSDFAISSLYIYRINDSYVGLFANITNGEIINLGLNGENTHITGRTIVGGLAGQINNTTIDNCHVVYVNITAQTIAGGGVGKNTSSSRILNSEFVTKLKIYGDVAGGIVGQNIDSTISKSTWAGGIEATGNTVGGIAGSSVDSSVEQCSSVVFDIGEMITAEMGTIGGIVGHLSGGKIIGSNSLITVQGSGSVGGLVGFAENTATIQNSHSAGNVFGSEADVGGLVGKLSNGQIIESRSIASVTGSSNVGGLVGVADQASLIQKSYTAGAIKDSGIAIGGLIGTSAGTIEDSYSQSYVAGADNVGGLVGVNTGIISNSLFSGYVSSESVAGGIAGISESGSTITDSFWNIETSNQAISAGGIGKTTAQMQAKSTYTDVNWDFDNDWSIYGQQYPQIRSSLQPIYVSSYVDLKKIGNDPDWPLDGYYVQTVDIDAVASRTENPIDGQNGNYYGFVPIGTIKVAYEYNVMNTPFTGIYNGAGFSVNNLYINRPEDIFIGLFGAVVGGELSNINLTNVSIVGLGYSAGLVGGNGLGVINNCSVSGSVNATDDLEDKFEVDMFVGGMVGENILGIVLNSSSDVDVTAATQFCSGGLVGMNNSGMIAGSYSSGVVISTFTNGSAGGNVGCIYNGSVVNSYATGSTSGRDMVGGLVGNFLYGDVVNSYATGVVSGDEMVGGLAGTVGGAYLSGNIKNSYATGEVVGDIQAGGLVGLLADGDIANSYSIGPVSGESQIGGLVGSSQGTITNSYSTGLISGTESVGGLIGALNNDQIINSFWDIETSGIEVSAGGTGLTTAEMQTQTTFTDAGWDYENTWGYRTDDYPYLQWQKHIYVTSYEDLKKIGVLTDWPLDGNYVQLADIDANASRNENNGQGFSPISDYTNQFTGTYDGSGYKIDSIYINRPDTQYIGLFAYCSGCSISNVNIAGNSSITGRDRTGGLVGMSLGYYGIVTIFNSTSSAAVTSTGDNYGYAGGLIGQARYLHNISNSSSTGAVSGAGRVGGLIGLVSDSSSSIISRCYATGDVISDTYAGGLIGAFTIGTLIDSYATGDISGSDLVGGLIGSVASAYVYNSYATGTVSAELDRIGGLIGQNSNTPITNSFWDIETSGQEISAGGTGLTTAEMQNQDSFTEWDFDTIWEIAPESYPVLQ